MSETREWYSPHGTLITWAGIEFRVLSFSFVSQSGPEIDVSSIESVTYADPFNLHRRLLVRDYDTFVSAVAGTELQCEFFIEQHFMQQLQTFEHRIIGAKGDLVLKTGFIPGSAGFNQQTGQPNPVDPERAVIQTVKAKAILREFNISGQTGELLRGSASFLMTGDTRVDGVAAFY